MNKHVFVLEIDIQIPRHIFIIWCMRRRFSAVTNLPNVLATILWPFLPGASQAWGPPASGHPNTLQLRHCFDTHILILPVSATCYSSTAIYIIYIDAERVIWMRSESSELAYTGKSQKYPPICMAKY